MNGPDDPRDEEAFGRPGIAPRWTSSSKEGVGTAYHTASRVWFTLSHGVLNEIYYPTIDRPQVRDLQFLITDGESFCHEEKRDLDSEIEGIDAHLTPLPTAGQGECAANADALGLCKARRYEARRCLADPLGPRNQVDGH